MYNFLKNKLNLFSKEEMIFMFELSSVLQVESNTLMSRLGLNKKKIGRDFLESYTRYIEKTVLDFIKKNRNSYQYQFSQLIISFLHELENRAKTLEEDKKTEDSNKTE